MDRTINFLIDQNQKILRNKFIGRENCHVYNTSPSIDKFVLLRATYAQTHKQIKSKLIYSVYNIIHQTAYYIREKLPTG